MAYILCESLKVIAQCIPLLVVQVLILSAYLMSHPEIFMVVDHGLYTRESLKLVAH